MENKFQSEGLIEALKSQSPLVSIIIPCYNKAEYISETIQSATSQNYPNIEIIVVDDGSTDHSVDTIERELVKNRSRKSSLIKRSNGGISAARNSGLSEANGAIVSCLDGDDLMDPSFISRSVDLMRKSGANLVCSDVEMFGAKSGRWRPEAYEPFAVKYNNSIPTLSVFDRDLWRSVGGYNTAFAFNEDWDFFIRCSAKGLSVSRIEEPLFKYRVTEDGLANRYIEDTWRFSVALMMTANDTLYPVEQVIYAHNELSEMPESWVKRLHHQLDLYPRSSLINLWLGLEAEKKGRIDEALFRFEVAARLTNDRDWQSLFKLGTLVGQKEPKARQQFYHAARTLRPDLTRYVIKYLAPAGSDHLHQYQLLTDLSFQK